MAAIEVKVPDIGDFKDVPVIEVLVKAGDVVKKDESLITLESDKATMEVPAPSSGTVRELRVKVGDKVSQGSAIALLDGGAEAAKPQPAPAQAPKAATSTPPSAPAPAAAPPSERPSPAAARAEPPATVASSLAAASPAAASSTPMPPAAAPALPVGSREGAVPAHASPGVRRFARELGVEISHVTGSGPKGRILKEDIQQFVKGALAGGAPGHAAGAGLGELGLPAWPKVDFAKFGPVERQARTRIQKISGPALARNWVMIPHVT